MVVLLILRQPSKVLFTKGCIVILTVHIHNIYACKCTLE